MNTIPKILIYGTGALGTIFGGFLQKNQCDVTFIGRSDHFRTILKEGIKISGIWGEHYISPIQGYTDYQAVEKKFDIILLCVKSIHTDLAAQQASSLLNADGIMISIQNGLNNIETISKYIGKNRTVGGRVIFGVEIAAPGHAVVTVYANKVLLGAPFDEVNKDLIKYINLQLNKSGIPTEIVSQKDIISSIWGKVLYNSALNPLGAILNVNYGKLGESQYAKSIMEEILKEIFIVLSRKGIIVNYTNYQEYFQYLLSTQIPATYDHHSSMNQDLSQGRKTEIDSLNGAISKHGSKLGISTPYNDLITRLIKFKEINEN